MDKKKLTGFLMILLAFVIAVWLFSDLGKKEKTSQAVSDAQQSERVEQIPVEPEETQTDDSSVVVKEETNIEDQNEAGGGEDETLIRSVDCRIGTMCDEIRADIEDMEGFEYAVKQYVFENGYIGAEIYSLDTVTINYQERWKQYLMGIEGENHYFCVVYDLDHGTYCSEKF